jgi:hypothetical protein
LKTARGACPAFVWQCGQHTKSDSEVRFRTASGPSQPTIGCTMRDWCYLEQAPLGDRPSAYVISK